MPRQVTVAGSNRYCQARLRAAKYNEDFASRATAVAGTLFIILAFTMNGERKIRIFDLIGALLFIIYGVTIRSFSTILLNVVLVVVQAYKLLRRRSE